MTNLSNAQGQYDFVVVGAGAAGSVLAAELSSSGVQVLVIESGGPDEAPTIASPSTWFYNVGGPLDYHLPVNPSANGWSDRALKASDFRIASPRPDRVPSLLLPRRFFDCTQFIHGPVVKSRHPGR
jgi:choline dehydrogenase-like flavoprotein